MLADFNCLPFYHIRLKWLLFSSITLETVTSLNRYIHNIFVLWIETFEASISTTIEN